MHCVGSRETPSWVAYTDEERLVGTAAKDQFATNPHRTIFEIVSPTSDGKVTTLMALL